MIRFKIIFAEKFRFLEIYYHQQQQELNAKCYQIKYYSKKKNSIKENSHPIYYKFPDNS